jgi:hypothetical protein
LIQEHQIDMSASLLRFTSKSLRGRGDPGALLEMESTFFTGTVWAAYARVNCPRDAILRASEVAARAAPDGYTLIMGTTGTQLNADIVKVPDSPRCATCCSSKARKPTR